jgi:hypothetical protein
VDAVLASPHAREARRTVLRRRLRRSVSSFAIWIPFVVVAALLTEIRGVPREVAAGAPFALLMAATGAVLLYRRSGRAVERATRDRDTYLAELSAAAPALTPAERDREMATVEAMGYDDAVVEDVRRRLASLPGGMRPLPALCVKDPDDWFRAGGPLKLRALVGYPALALACAVPVIAISSAGLEAIEWLGLVTFLMPGALTWRDDELADAQPGERAAWALAATWMFFVWLVAGLLVIRP